MLSVEEAVMVSVPVAVESFAGDVIWIEGGVVSGGLSTMTVIEELAEFPDVSVETAVMVSVPFAYICVSQE